MSFCAFSLFPSCNRWNMHLQIKINLHQKRKHLPLNYPLWSQQIYLNLQLQVCAMSYFQSHEILCLSQSCVESDFAGFLRQD